MATAGRVLAESCGSVGQGEMASGQGLGESEKAAWRQKAVVEQHLQVMGAGDSSQRHSI